MGRFKHKVMKSIWWLILIPFVIFLLHSLLFFPWLIDDAGISFSYARNCAHGHGLVSQAGVEPVEGFSNPLWTFLLMPIFTKEPADPTIVIKCISLLITLATFFIVHKIAQELFHKPFWSSLVTLAVLLLLSVNTSFVVWTSSGLENPLNVFLVALYCLLCLRYIKTIGSQDKLSILVGITAAGLALTRPDGILYILVFPILVALKLCGKLSRWRHVLRNLLVYSVAAALPLLIYLIFRYVYFGDVFPNAYYAKGGPTLRNFLCFLFLTRTYWDKTYHLFWSLLSWRAGLTILILGVCTTAVMLKGKNRLPLIVVFLMAYVAAAIYCLLPTDWMGEYRLATPFFLLFYISVFSLLVKILIDLFSSSSRFRLTVFGVLFGLLLLSSVETYLPRSFRFAKNPTVPLSRVALRYGLTFNYYADRLGISEASLLCPDVGGTLYFSRHRVYDLTGLCDRRIARLIGKDTEGLKDYVFEELQPTFIHIHDYWSVVTDFQSDPRFKRLYEPIVESPSLWAKRQGKGEYYFCGDYVRKDAVLHTKTLEDLKTFLGKGTQELSEFNKGRTKPFPRG